MKVYQKLIEKKIISVNEEKFEVTFTPDNSQWSNYYLIIGGTFKSLVLADPTVRVVGSPLFFEFLNTDSNPISVTFSTAYNAGKGIFLPPNEVVSCIMVFDERYQWTSYTPWTCQGISLSNRGRAQVILPTVNPLLPRTLTGNEYLRRIIDVSGTISEARELIFSLDDGSDWLVRNNTAQNIIVRGIKGISVTIPPGYVKGVFTDGSAFYGLS